MLITGEASLVLEVCVVNEEGVAWTEGERMTNLKVVFGERWGCQVVFGVVGDGDALLAMLSHFSFCLFGGEDATTASDTLGEEQGGHRLATL